MPSSWEPNPDDSAGEVDIRLGLKGLKANDQIREIKRRTAEQLHPVAYKWLRFSRKVFLIGLPVIFLTFFVLSRLWPTLTVAGVYMIEWPIILIPLWILFWGLVRIALLSLFFAKYSLGQIMKATFVLGGLISLSVSMPEYIQVFSILLTIVFLVFIAVVVWSHDPDGDGHTPEFVREQLRQQREAARQKRREQNQSGT